MERKKAEESMQRAREELEGKVERQILRRNPYGLTFRELTVLHLVSSGMPDKGIGIELGISPLTAQKHISNILAKMEASCRTEASVRAVREGLLE
jgi:DNA-binding NarL/FixJ family response regulator